MRYFIMNSKETAKGVNINGARLYSWDGLETSDAVGVLDFERATNKGWRSTKAILVDFPYILNEGEFDGSALEITEEVAHGLIAQYNGVKVKIYTQPISKSAGRQIALANWIAESGSDPWDTQGIFNLYNPR